MSFDFRKQVIVIGAEIGGLATAARLAAIGHHVRIFESQPQVGGKLNRIKMQGFSFDTGPSLITMPGVLHGLFQAAGKRLEEYLHLVPLDITCRYFYRGGAGTAGARMLAQPMDFSRISAWLLLCDLATGHGYQASLFRWR